MGNEFKDFEMETPSLTLEPDLGEFEKKEEVIPKKQTQKEEVLRTDTGRTENGK